MIDSKFIQSHIVGAERALSSAKRWLEKYQGIEADTADAGQVLKLSDFLASQRAIIPGDRTQGDRLESEAYSVMMESDKKAGQHLLSLVADLKGLHRKRAKIVEQLEKIYKTLDTSHKERTQPAVMPGMDTRRPAGRTSSMGRG